MSENKKQKIKKLQKVHAWISILVLVCSVICAIGCMGIAIKEIFDYSIKDRIKTFYSNSLYIARIFEEDPQGENDEKIIDYLKSNGELAEAVYLLDENNNVISGFGGMTFDFNTKNNLDINSVHKLERDLNINFGKGFSIYLDKNADEITKYIIDEGINLGMVEKEKLNVNSFPFLINLNTILSKRNEVLYEFSIWFSTPITNQKELMVKNKICFYYDDLIYILLVLIIVVIMLIPTLFMFILVISNTLNQKKISKLLYIDSVTGGYNWRYFEQYACKVLCARRNSNRLFAIVDVSIMKYGSFCTFHGVKKGEELLKYIDDQLLKFMEKSEYSARYGMSSFSILLHCPSKENCEKRVNEMISELAEKTKHKGILFHAGIYFIEPEKDENGKRIKRKKIDIGDFYNCASNARAAITDDNHSEVITFDQKLRDEQIWEHKVEEKMQSALDNEEFKVYIQPKYNPVSEELSGAEALVRWINEEDGFISPGRFIPLFEKNGFITKLDDYMLSHVAKLQASWLEQGKELVPISVNVSRAHFADPNLAEHICSIIDEYNVPHNLIEIELTESAFFDDKTALLNTVCKLKNAGFDISMDDFGAGYSSLNSLKDLPLDVLKLDAEFFRGENGEGRGEIVVSKAIQLAKELNMRIVAEGVEKKDQVDFLAAQDCDMIQGFYFAKPMPAEEYETRLKTAKEK